MVLTTEGVLEKTSLCYNLQYKLNRAILLERFKENFPDIYGFMDQNLFALELNSLIIYSIRCVNNETHFKHLKNTKK